MQKDKLEKLLLIMKDELDEEEISELFNYDNILKNEEILDKLLALSFLNIKNAVKSILSLLKYNKNISVINAALDLLLICYENEYISLQKINQVCLILNNPYLLKLKGNKVIEIAKIIVYLDNDERERAIFKVLNNEKYLKRKDIVEIIHILNNSKYPSLILRVLEKGIYNVSDGAKLIEQKSTMYYAEIITDVLTNENILQRGNTFTSKVIDLINICGVNKARTIYQFMEFVQENNKDELLKLGYLLTNISESWQLQIIYQCFIKYGFVDLAILITNTFINLDNIDEALDGLLPVNIQETLHYIILEVGHYNKLEELATLNKLNKFAQLVGINYTYTKEDFKYPAKKENKYINEILEVIESNNNEEVNVYETISLVRNKKLKEKKCKKID